MTRSEWIGQTIGGRYEIQDLLGQGGMSAVYKAYDPNLRRVVAVKIIHSHLSQDSQFIHRFEEEAASVAQLRHPNIIQVFDFNHDDNVYFIVFEFIPGETVQARLKRLKAAGLTMDVDEAANIARQVAEGLQNAHSKGLIHRDIKPANIMLNLTGTPIIMDFGIAKIMGGTQHTATGAVLGTARYMSPEQIQGTVVDPRTDIYSLGVTLFEMLGGRPPFEANSAMSLMMMHMTDPVPDLNALRSEVPPQLVAIVNKSLAKKPEDRYLSAAAMAKALANTGTGTALAGATMLEGAAAKQDLDKTIVEPPVYDSRPAAGAAAAAGMAAASTPATAPTGPVSAPPPAKTGGSRMPLIIGGAVILLLLIAGGIWAAFFRSSGSEVTEGPTEVPAVVVDATETPDTAATEEAIAVEATAVAGTVAAEEGTRAAEVETAATDTAEPLEEPTKQPPPTIENTAEATLIPESTVESVANVDQVDGQVSIISPDGAETPLTADTPITEGSQIITGPDGQLALTLDDNSTLQLLEDGQIRLDSLGSSGTNELQQTAFTLFSGDMLLQVPPGSSEQAIFSDAGLLLATVANANAAADIGKSHALGKRVEQSGTNAAMSIGLEGARVFISCFSGDCSTYGGNSLSAGWEKVITVDGGFISSFPITNQSDSYKVWQESCQGCLPQAPPPPTATFTPIPATNTPTPGSTVTATATTVGTPTATTEATPTAAGGATSEPTSEATEEASPTPAAPSYSARITNIALNNGRYIVDFTTSGFTPALPGRHVHFFFDTVSTANAGVPGSGPWKLYGGSSPFTEYSEADKYFDPSAMCILVANEDHSIIPGTGNCFPLP